MRTGQHFHGAKDIIDFGRGSWSCVIIWARGCVYVAQNVWFWKKELVRAPDNRFELRRLNILVKRFFFFIHRNNNRGFGFLLPINLMRISHEMLKYFIDQGKLLPAQAKARQIRIILPLVIWLLDYLSLFNISLLLLNLRDRRDLLHWLLCLRWRWLHFVLWLINGCWMITL